MRERWIPSITPHRGDYVKLVEIAPGQWAREYEERGTQVGNDGKMEQAVHTTCLECDPPPEPLEPSVPGKPAFAGKVELFPGRWVRVYVEMGEEEADGAKRRYAKIYEEPCSDSGKTSEPPVATSPEAVEAYAAMETPGALAQPKPIVPSSAPAVRTIPLLRLVPKPRPKKRPARRPAEEAPDATAKAFRPPLPDKAKLVIPEHILAAYLVMVCGDRRPLRVYLGKPSGKERADSLKSLKERFKGHLWLKSPTRASDWTSGEELGCYVRVILDEKGARFYVTIHPGRRVVNGIYSEREYKRLSSKLSERRRPVLRPGPNCRYHLRVCG